MDTNNMSITIVITLYWASTSYAIFFPIEEYLTFMFYDIDLNNEIFRSQSFFGLHYYL